MNKTKETLLVLACLSGLGSAVHAEVELSYSNSRLTYYHNNSNEYSSKIGNVNIGMQSDNLRYGLSLYAYDNSNSNAHNGILATLGSAFGERMYFEGGIGKIGSPTSSNELNLMKALAEYNLDTFTVGARFLNFDDTSAYSTDSQQFRTYMTYAPNDEFFGGVMLLNSRAGDSSSNEVYAVGQYETGPYALRGHYEQFLDGLHLWETSIAGSYEVVDKFNLIGGYRSWVNNSSSNASYTYTIGSSYDVTDTVSLTALYGDWYVDGSTTAIPSFSLSLEYKLGKAPNQEQAIWNVRDGARFIGLKRHNSFSF